MTFIKENLPRLTSSTRLVLLTFSGVLWFATVWALVNASEFFPDIFTGFMTSIGAVIWFFFVQRDVEHKTFAKVQQNKDDTLARLQAVNG